MDPRRTPFFEHHVEAGGRLVEFAGWTLPVLYSSLMKEHHAVRSSAGLFDVSHMGEVEVSGPGAMAFSQRLVTNDVSRLVDGQALYSPMCQEDGGIVDDLLVYRLAQDRWFFCFNGATADKDVAWMEEIAAGFDCRFEDQREGWAQLALQGPRAQDILARVAETDLGMVDYYHFVTEVTVAGIRGCRVARTGYTGEDGFEVFVPIEEAPALWPALMEAGGDALLPCGLGARDTLRLEAGFLLYGNDISEETNPLEAGLGWTVKPETGFVGHEALARIKEQGLQRRLVGFEMLDRGVARHNMPVLEPNGQVVGQVSSGSHSPTLGKAIGLAYVPMSLRKRGSEFDIQIRGQQKRACVVKTPFYKRSEA